MSKNKETLYHCSDCNYKTQKKYNFYCHIKSKKHHQNVVKCCDDNDTDEDDEENNIYLAKIKNFEKKTINKEKLDEYNNKLNSNIKNTMLKSYDLFLNDKYDVVLNQKTIERVKNFFQ